VAAPAGIVEDIIVRSLKSLTYGNACLWKRPASTSLIVPYGVADRAADVNVLTRMAFHLHMPLP
jgi:hypothetical protein